MDISVIIPTYKPQLYIWECLDSLRKQTLDKNRFEVLIVLNGCKEPYLSQIKTYINENQGNVNIKLIHTDCPGVSNARNIGLECSKGDYITFIDDDDYVSPTYLEELFKKVDTNVVALSNTTAIDENMNERPYSIGQTFKRQHLKGKQVFYYAKKYFSGPCMKLISKEIIGNRRFDVNFVNGEDSQFMFLISDKIKYVDFTSSEAIYYRRIRQGSATTSLSYTGKLRNLFKTIPSYTRTFVKGFPRYNFYFYMTRILGALHSLM